MYFFEISKNAHMTYDPLKDLSLLIVTFAMVCCYGNSVDMSSCSMLISDYMNHRIFHFESLCFWTFLNRAMSCLFHPFFPKSTGLCRVWLEFLGADITRKKNHLTAREWSPPKLNSSPPKNGGWKTIRLPFGFRAMLKLRVGILESNVI